MNTDARLKEIANEVLEMAKVCDRSKLDDIEIDRLEKLVKLADLATCDLDGCNQITAVK